MVRAGRGTSRPDRAGRTPGRSRALHPPRSTHHPRGRAGSPAIPFGADRGSVRASSNRSRNRAGDCRRAHPAWARRDRRPIGRWPRVRSGRGCPGRAGPSVRRRRAGRTAMAVGPKRLGNSSDPDPLGLTRTLCGVPWSRAAETARGHPGLIRTPAASVLSSHGGRLCAEHASSVIIAP